MLAIVVAVLIAYHNSFSGPFVFDDKGAILDNPTIRRLWPPGDVLSPPIAGLPVTGRPLTNVSFALNHALHGTSVSGYHVVNFVIHLACALVLFGLIRRTLNLPRCHDRFGRDGLAIAAASALLWAVHPLPTAGVTYLAQRAESLASLCILLALYAFVRSTGAVRPNAWLAGAVLAGWLGVGMKEIAAAVPVLVALFDRTFISSSWREIWRQRAFFYGALAAAWLPLAWLIQSTENRGSTWGADSGFTPWNYALIQCEAVIHYLRLVVWPAPLVFDYGRNLPVPTGWSVLPSAAVLIGLLIANLIGLRRWPAAAFLGVCFFVILAPTSSVLPIADAIFEHRMYLPSAAVIVGAVVAAHCLFGIRARWAMGVIALGLIGLTIDRNGDYRSAVELWQDTVSKRPTNARARGNLGEELMKEKRYVEAIVHFEAAYRLTPDLPIVPHNLAVALDFAGRREEAIGYYRKALGLQPKNFLSRTNLANALAAQGMIEEALSLYAETVRDVPDFAEAQTGYARALLRAGRTAEAIERFRRAIELRPRDPERHFDLGDALVRAGRVSESIAPLSEAVRLQPDHLAALNNLGNALLITRQVPQAIAAFEAALRITPDAMTHTNLGLALLLSQRREDAIPHFESALRLNPDYAPARSALDRARAGRR